MTACGEAEVQHFSNLDGSFDIDSSEDESRPNPLSDQGNDLDLSTSPDTLSDRLHDATNLLDDGTGDIDMSALPSTVHELYQSDRIQSPVTASVAEHMRAISALNPAHQEDVFMKVGASSTVSAYHLYCFADDEIALDGRDSLWTPIDYYIQGNANDFAGEGSLTPFDRDTYAAESGRTAVWAMDGTPSPVDQEIESINPSAAIVHYGTNDMGMGTTYLSAMWNFYDSYTALVDHMTTQGILPILVGINARGDSANADLWVPTYNAVIRGIAQARQIPFLDLHLAMNPLPDRGLASDGIHNNIYVLDGWTRPCHFTPEGLQFGHNLRNMITLESLDRVRQVMDDEVESLDASTDPLIGDGSSSWPFVINQLPFTHQADTTHSPHRNLNEYLGCFATQDESGPEYLYRFEIEEETPVRILVLDSGEVDVDVHILSNTISEEACLIRDHQDIQGILQPGHYTLALDTYVSGDGEEMAGEYMIVVLTCEEDDTDCSVALN
jgi:hypothetical protein